MNNNRSASYTLFLLLVAVCAWFGVVLQLAIAIPNYLANGKTLARALVLFFSYFTILTNLMVAITTSAALLFPQSKFGQFCTKSSTITAVTLYIVVVGLVYNFVLRPLYHPQGWDKVADETVHSVVPLLHIIYWLRFASKGSIPWKAAVSWLIYPLIYFIYCFVHGMLTGYYPYPFINVNKIGYAGFWLNSFYMLLLFLFLSFALIALDRWLGKRNDRVMAA